MPIFMDRHNVESPTADALEDAHDKDLAIQSRYRVDFLTYWFDNQHDCVFCLVEAPDRESVTKVHAEAHGMVPHDIIEVDLPTVESFLGRTADPEEEPAGDDKVRLPIDSAFRAILFTDLKGSTSMSVTMGDAAAIDLLDAHDRIIRNALANHGGREVKHTGDGIMAAFTTVDASIRCAVDIQRGFDEFNGGRPDSPLSVRIGINAGQPVERSGDLFGVTVQLAARVCDHANPGEILVTGIVQELFANAHGDIDVVRADKAHFKGLNHALQLYAVSPAA